MPLLPKIFPHPSIVPHGLAAHGARHGGALRRPAPSAAAGAAAAAGGGGAEGCGFGPARRRKRRAAVARWIRVVTGDFRFENLGFDLGILENLSTFTYSLHTL